jgi:hypothetical protein
MSGVILNPNRDVVSRSLAIAVRRKARIEGLQALYQTWSQCENGQGYDQETVQYLSELKERIGKQKILLQHSKAYSASLNDFDCRQPSSDAMKAGRFH